MRQRLAPIDIRTETSCARAAARASSRLATLAHAISSTNATAPVIAVNSATMGPPTPPRNASSARLRCRGLVSGCALASDEITPWRSARAWSQLTDSRIRPNPLRRPRLTIVSVLGRQRRQRLPDLRDHREPETLGASLRRRSMGRR